MKETEETGDQSEVQKDPVLEWVSHPARKKPVAAVLVAIFIGLVAVGIYTWTYSPLFTALASLILLGSLAGFYFPTGYRLYEDHIVVKYTITSMKKNWSAYRSFYTDRNGVLLSPFPRPSRLENFRGVYLRFGDFDKQKIIDFVRSKIGGTANGA